MISPMASGEKHLPVLDGIRGLAILLVLVYHQTVLVPACWLDGAFSRIARIGWCGVDLFFVLSGFLITGVLLDSKERPRYFRNFYARRVLRIFPLYYAVLAFVFFFLPRLYVSPTCDPAAFAGQKKFYWLYLGNYIMKIQGGFRHEVLSVTWSLSIEEQFYMLWPLVVFLLSRKRLLRLCAAIVVLTLVARTALVLTGSSPIPIYVLTPLRLDGLAVGALLAAYFRGGELPADPIPTARRVVVLSGCLTALIWAIPDDYEWFGSVMQEFGYSTLAILFGAILVLAVRSEAGALTGRFFRSRALRFLGKYSYALYLFHFPIKSWVKKGLWGPGPLPTWLGSALPAQLLFYVTASLPAILLALLSWNLFEKRFLSLKRYFA
jgi:peptidoglycan/LPS O-acetylase OafA/YrhL